MKHLILIAYILTGTAFAQTESTVNAQNWLQTVGLQIFIGLYTQPLVLAQGRVSLLESSYEGVNIITTPISPKIFKDLLSFESDLNTSHILNLRLSREEQLRRTINDFVSYNGISTSEFQHEKMKQLQDILIEIITTLYLSKKMSTRNPSLIKVHAKTLSAVSWGLDQKMDAALTALALFIQQAQPATFKEEKLFFILNNLENATKNSHHALIIKAKESFKGMQRSQLAEALTKKISNVYIWNRSMFTKQFQCRAYFSK